MNAEKSSIFNFQFSIMKVRAKKHLGQHFLIDMDIARRTAESLPLAGKTDVLEIGPGMGVLTQFLLQNSDINLTAIELDSESVAYLHKHYPQLRVIEGDFLQLDLNKMFPDTNFRIIGNFPYNISSQILFRMLDYKDKIPALCGMFQKEVAERIASPAGKKAYGILSVLLQAFYTVEYLFTISEDVFDPPPKVKSAVVRLIRNDVSKLNCNEQLFKTVVKTAFNQRRKTLRNSIKPLLGKESPIYADPIFDKRPEQLNVAEFVQLTNMIEEAQRS